MTRVLCSQRFQAFECSVNLWSKGPCVIVPPPIERSGRRAGGFSRGTVLGFTCSFVCSLTDCGEHQVPHGGAASPFRAQHGAQACASRLR